MSCFEIVEFEQRTRFLLPRTLPPFERDSPRPDTPSRHRTMYGNLERRRSLGEKVVSALPSLETRWRSSFHDKKRDKNWSERSRPLLAMTASEQTKEVGWKTLPLFRIQHALQRHSYIGGVSAGRSFCIFDRSVCKHTTYSSQSCWKSNTSSCCCKPQLRHGENDRKTDEKRGARKSKVTPTGPSHYYYYY